jgi:competence protein ComEC
MFTAGPSLEMKVLGPPAELFSGTNSDPNNNSLVLHLQYKEMNFLFTGDIETEAVENLLREEKIPPVQILKVPHHGGHLANLPQFLDDTAPHAAVITVGTNSFGHPHPSTLAALEDRGVEIFRTDFHGGVIVQSNGYEYTIKVVLNPCLPAVFAPQGKMVPSQLVYGN